MLLRYEPTKVRWRKVAAALAVGTASIILYFAYSGSTPAGARTEPVVPSVDTGAFLQCDSPEVVGGSVSRVAGPSSDKRPPEQIVADIARSGMAGQGRAAAAMGRAHRDVHTSADRRDLAYTDPAGKIVAVYTFVRPETGSPLVLDSWTQCNS